MDCKSIGSAFAGSNPAPTTRACGTQRKRRVFVNGCTEDSEWSEAECGCVFAYDEYLEANRTDPEDWSSRVNEVLADGFSTCECAGVPVA